VFQRIEADAPKPPCRVVAEKMRDEAVRGFMKGDGDNHRNDPDRRQINHTGSHCSIPPATAVGGKLHFDDTASKSQRGVLFCRSLPKINSLSRIA
jgi:hypothetical protein